MGMCDQCGAELMDGLLFCKKCGTPIEEMKYDKNSPLVQPANADQEKPTSKKKRIIIYSCITAIALFIVVNILIEFNFSYDQIAGDFEEEIKETEGNKKGNGDFIKDFSEEELVEFMNTYFFMQVVSLNGRDFTILEPYIDPNGEIYHEHKDKLVYVKSKFIFKEFLSSDMKLVDFEKVDGGYLVTTNEKYNIFEGDGTSKNSTYESQYYLTVVEGELRAHTLNETNEIATVELN